MMKESSKSFSKECLVEPATLRLENVKRELGRKTPLFVFAGNYSSTIKLSSVLPGQEECNRANNSLMVRQTERHVAAE